MNDDTTTPAPATERSSAAFVRRNLPLAVAALALVIGAGAGGAVAGTVITGQQIRDYSITSKDIAAGSAVPRLIPVDSISASKLTAAARASLKGQPGAPGSRWLTGPGAPGTLDARDGDWYLDVTAQAIYTREGGTWELVTTLAGADGKDGADGRDGADGKNGTVWLSGPVAPARALGADGDWYLNTTTSLAYQKTDGTWFQRVNLTGATGAKGDTGAAGAKGDKGDKGETGAAGAKGETGAAGAKGDKGDKGETGAAGAKGDKGDDGLDGATWLAGTGAPASSVGKDTDLYLDTSTSDVHRKSGGAWALLTNIKGQKGDPGPKGLDGTNGANGTNGSAWFTGTAAPTTATGVDGDFYLDTSTGDLYRKSSGSWGRPIADLVTAGSGGGSTWSAGSGAPDAASVDPTAGAFYLNTTNGAIYTADGTTWTVIYTPGAAAEQFPNVEVAAASTTSQTFPTVTVTANDAGAAASAQPVAFGSPTGGTSLSGGNTWNGTTFTVGDTGAGWYTFSAQARVGSSPAFDTANATNSVHLFLTKNTATYPVPFTAANGWLAQSASSPNLSQVTNSARNVTQVSTTVRLAAGDQVRVLGLTASAVAAATTVADGSTNITVTRIE